MSQLTTYTEEREREREREGERERKKKVKDSILFPRFECSGSTEKENPGLKGDKKRSYFYFYSVSVLDENGGVIRDTLSRSG